VLAVADLGGRREGAARRPAQLEARRAPGARAAASRVLAGELPPEEVGRALAARGLRPALAVGAQKAGGAVAIDPAGRPAERLPVGEREALRARGRAVGGGRARQA